MKKKKIMILGAGIYQVPLIRKAKEMGLFTIAVSRPGNYPGFSVADKTLFLDTTDAAGILQAAREEKICGITTSGTDVAVKTIGHVCDALQLNGISEKSASIMTDKALMKQAFSKEGVPTTPFCIVNNLREAEAGAYELGFPAMVKACRSSGSRGVTMVENPGELKTAFRDAEHISGAEHVLIEKVADGYEIGLDAFVENGKIVSFFPHNKIMGIAGKVHVPVGHIFPINVSDEMNRALYAVLKKIITATGTDNCAINADIMIDPVMWSSAVEQKKNDGQQNSDTFSGINVLEAGGRCGATCIPELIEHYSGIDYYRQIISSAIGETLDFTVLRQTPSMGKILMSGENGRVISVDYKKIHELEEETGAEISIDVGVGDSVHAMRNGTDRIGQIILETSDEKELENISEKVIECITIQE